MYFLKKLYLCAGLALCLSSAAVVAETNTDTDSAAIVPGKGLVETEHEVLINIAEAVVAVPLREGVSADDAVASMKLKANALNIKFIAHQPLWQEYEALGLPDIRRTEIFQFCDARVAKRMLDHDINFLAYMPCRIGLIEDQNNQFWLITTNLNIFLTTTVLPEDLLKMAEKVRDDIEAILDAGVNGDL
jgi:hypothetical protein